MFSDLNRIVVLLLPPHRRKPKLIALSVSVLSVFKWLLNDVYSFVNETKEVIGSSAQVAVIEKNICDILCLPGVIVLGEVADYQGYIAVESSVDLSDSDRAKIQDYIQKIQIVGLQKPLIIIS